MEKLREIFLAILLLTPVSTLNETAFLQYFRQNKQHSVQNTTEELSPKTNQRFFRVQKIEMPDLDSISSLVHYFNKKGFEIEKILCDERFKIHNEICDKFRYSAEKTARNIQEYKEKIGFESKRKNISAFMKKNISQLTKAEKTYGISKEIISAVLGIESDFGKNAGRYNPFNAYISMYLDGCKKNFAKTQLEELLIFCEKNNLDVLELKSSYAGAISYCQFIPWSLNRWFVGNNLCNINNDILSVAKYLSYFKETTGSLKEAILNYNPSKWYAETVIELAKIAKEAEKIEARALSDFKSK